MSLQKYIKESLIKRPKPWIVDGNFYCFDNPKLTSLEGSPNEVSGLFLCKNNPNLPKEEIIKLKESGTVKGTIYSDYGTF